MNSNKVKNKQVTSNGIRHRYIVKSNEITYEDSPFEKLTIHRARKFGIDNRGRRTCCGKRKGSYHKYRIIDWKRDKFDIPGIVTRIERDPNRSSNIALIKYKDGEYRYILSPKNLAIGQQVLSTHKTDLIIDIGNAMPLGNIPTGTLIHNIEINPLEGGKLLRSAGSYGTVLNHQDERTIIKMKSGEVRSFSSKCFATLGEVGNSNHNKNIIGSAGKNFYLGRKSLVRGSAKNPCDHPHGGGEGKQPLGRHPVNFKGKPMFGKKRSVRKFTNKFIIKHRNKSKY